MGFSSKVIKHGDVLIIELSGKIISPEDVKQISEIKDGGELEKFNKVILDCKDLTHMVSSGLNLMVRILTKSRIHGGDAVICNLNPSLINVFNITKLDNIFRIFLDREEAIKFLKSN